MVIFGLSGARRASYLMPHLTSLAFVTVEICESRIYFRYKDIFMLINVDALSQCLKALADPSRLRLMSLAAKVN